MRKILLDREGNVPVPAEATLVTEEVAFLRLALEGGSIVVRGERLCQWAETFFNGRQIAFKRAKSYLSEILTSLPVLSVEQAQGLVNRLGQAIDEMQQPIRAVDVLEKLYPHWLWRGRPSVQHLAEWLRWFYKVEPETFLLPILSIHVQYWQLSPASFDPQVYDIVDSSAARQALRKWLGLDDRTSFPVQEEFPLEVPDDFKVEARTEWRLRIIDSQGKFFAELDQRRIPFSLKRIAAEETCAYYQTDRNTLDREAIDRLAPYLRSRELAVLRKFLPPHEPANIPETPADVLSWFIHQYLPYREWQRAYGSETAREKVLKSARQFALWYINHYSQAFSGGSIERYVSFNKVNTISCPENGLTLVIVLDGLHVPDSRTLLQEILSVTGRLSVITQEYVFAPIPTVTEFAKEALFRGVPPYKIDSAQSIGEILPQNHSPAVRLKNAPTGKVVLWRLLEPDTTYHHNNHSENLISEVEGRLRGEALKIKEIVETIPDSVVLQLILTTDHGRLLGESHKTLPVPTGWESHGRVAWGKCPKALGEKAFEVDGDVVTLDGEAYGMTADLTFPLDESAFLSKDNHSGSELFPHGGAFPEEIIIPWICLARDVVRPTVDFKLEGSGRARREGTFRLHIINSSDLVLTLDELRLTLRDGAIIRLPVQEKVGIRSPKDVIIPYAPWPSANECESTSAEVRVLLPNNLTFEYIAKTKLISEDIYTRTPSGLEDMR